MAHACLQITLGTPRVIFKKRYNRSDGVWPNYDVTPDGRRLLMVRSLAKEVPARVNVVLNWPGATPAN